MHIIAFLFSSNLVKYIQKNLERGGDMYNAKFMEWTCSCGHKTANAKIGITSNYAVQATWKCQRCGKIPVAIVTLQSMAENVPPPPHERTFYDSVFLKKAHILEEL